MPDNQIPNPLPPIVPIGTKIFWLKIPFTSLTVGVYANSCYTFSKVVNDLTNIQHNEMNFLPTHIIWNELPIALNEVKEQYKLNLTINCFWCNKEIDNGMTLCSSHNSKCQKYYDTLTERMALSYLKPTDAHEYDRACVKNYIDNKESK